MPLLAKFEIGPSIQQYHLVETISDKEIQVAMQKFNAMREYGTLKSDFEDEKWYMTNETNTVSIDFVFDEFAIYKQPNISFNDFVKLVKYYICLCFGDYTLHMYPRIVNAIKNAVAITNCFTQGTKDFRSLQYNAVGDFLSLLPWVDEQFIMPTAENQYGLRRRSLAEYQSYFMFNDIIIAFWKIASEAEKDFFYPIYLWWNISMIIPIRVTEFSVIPRECLKNRNNKWYLTIRRTAIKGKTDFEKRYKLDTDYKKYTYEITEVIAKDILDYQKRSKVFEKAEIDSMFSDSMFVESKNKLFSYAKQFVIYPHMRQSHFQIALDYFYVEIIEKRLHYKICKKNDMEEIDIKGEKHVLSKEEIVKLNLGDTRHIALQNLLLNGCNILMAKEISGHYTVDMIFHYSSNIKNLIRCKAYGLYELSKKNVNAISLASKPDRAEFVLGGKFSESYIEVDGGKCFSPKFVQEQDVSDCYAVGGNCSLCIFHKKNEGQDDTLAELERDFDDKIARVKIWTNSAKKMKDKEIIMVAAEKMSTAASNLEVAYIKKIEEGGKL